MVTVLRPVSPHRSHTLTLELALRSARSFFARLELGLARGVKVFLYVGHGSQLTHVIPFRSQPGGP